jgi:hypothetical protein
MDIAERFFRHFTSGKHGVEIVLPLGGMFEVWVINQVMGRSPQFSEAATRGSYCVRILVSKV